jgi:hypothetical protein
MDKNDRESVMNPVLRDALARIEERKRCAFPFWGNWGNWRNWSNWGNWRNFHHWNNWHRGWRNW